MSRSDAFFAGSLAAILMALLVPFARIGVDMHHDGVMLKPALDVLSGQVLFRDTFMQYGALTCYLQVAALWVLPTLLSMKLLAVVGYGATLFVLYASWRLVLPRSLTVFSSSLFILFVPCYEKNVLGNFWILFPWSSVFAMFFQSIGLYALFQVIRGVNSVRWGFVLGLVCAAVFWCRQPVGVTMFGSLIIIWLGLYWTKWNSGDYPRRSIQAAFGVGAIVLTAPMLLSILISGAESAWWYQNFVWPRKWAEAGMTGNWSWGHVALQLLSPAAGARLAFLLLVIILPSVLKRFWPKLTRHLIIIYFVCLAGILLWQKNGLLEVLDLRSGGWTTLLPVAILIQVLVCAGRMLVDREATRTTECYLIVAWSVFSLGSVLQYFPVPDAWHILWSLAPAFGLLVFLFWHSFNWRPSVVLIGFTAAFLPAIWNKARSAAQFLAEPRVTLTAPSVLRGSQVSPEKARWLGRMAEIIKRIEQKRPDISSVMIGNDALYLCFTQNLANPSPYFVTWKGLAPDGEIQKRGNYISKVRPLVFLLNADQKAVEGFLVNAGYVTLLDVPAEGLKMAVPEELAQATEPAVSGPSP